jgi:RNA polymerase sigma-70 factor (ECF subfamily)
MISTQIQLDNNFSYVTITATQMYAVKSFEQRSEDLVNLLQQKCEKGFSQLYDNYSDALFCEIYQIVARETIAEDLLQDTFVKIWKKIDTYDKSKASLYTWMLNIARNTSIDFIRSRKNEFNRSILNDDILQSDYLIISDVIDNSNRLDFISIKNKAALLDYKYAVVLDLIYFEGFTYEQVANLLRLPLGTVKTRGRMALTLLKKGM